MRFHLSIPVRNLAVSQQFYVNVLDAKVTHADDGGYLDLDFHGTQITLHQQPSMPAPLASMHFGMNLPTSAFLALTQKVERVAAGSISNPLAIVDAGTERERRKMFLRDPDGYQIELKGMDT